MITKLREEESMITHSNRKGHCNYPYYQSIVQHPPLMQLILKFCSLQDSELVLIA